MLNRFSHNWTLKLTALILSIALWGHVRGQVNPWENANFKVRLQAEAPRGYLLQNEAELPRTIVVTLRGPRLALRALKGPAPANPLAGVEDVPLLPVSQLRATLDFANPRKGEQNAVIKVNSRIEDVEVIGTRPEEVAVTLDAAESRSFTIRPFVPASENLEVQRIRSGVEKARVSGPSKLLDQVARVRARVSRAELKAGVVRLSRVPLEAVDDEGAPLSAVLVEPEFVDVEIRAREKSGEKSVRVVVQTTGEPEADFQTGVIESIPPRLTLRGPRSALARIDSLPVRVDVNGAASTIERSVRVDIPDGVEAANRRVRVRVNIKPSGAASLPPITSPDDAGQSAPAATPAQPDIAGSPSSKPSPAPTPALPAPAQTP